MANSKIDSLKVGNSTYDITLPVDATPTIASLTTSTLTVKGTSNLTDVNCSSCVVGTYNVGSVISNLGTQVTYSYTTNTLTITTK